MHETWVLSLGWEDPLEKEMTTHSSILAWKIPWGKTGGPQFMDQQRVRHDRSTNTLSEDNSTCGQRWRILIEQNKKKDKGRVIFPLTLDEAFPTPSLT